MTTEEILRAQIVELEKLVKLKDTRIAALEARPVYHPYMQPAVWYPWHQPYIWSSANTIGSGTVTASSTSFQTDANVGCFQTYDPTGNTTTSNANATNTIHHDNIFKIG